MVDIKRANKREEDDAIVKSRDRGEEVTIPAKVKKMWLTISLTCKENNNIKLED